MANQATLLLRCNKMCYNAGRNWGGRNRFKIGEVMAVISMARRRQAWAAGVVCGATGQGKCDLEVPKLKEIYAAGVTYGRANVDTVEVRAMVEARRRKFAPKAPAVPKDRFNSRYSRDARSDSRGNSFGNSRSDNFGNLRSNTGPSHGNSGPSRGGSGPSRGNSGPSSGFDRPRRGF